ncbi:ABC transporter G family member 33-like [Rosa rugosa]|uniref:ABC transporter G family member 33-like n=1 Tax=Rosa rugosa TaxID=74645 RepID=UPI002B41436D|nr:ABC transporter G family member 33-like [Rosa rugosa]
MIVSSSFPSLTCEVRFAHANIMLEVSRREKEAGIVPDPDIDTYMKAISVEGQKKNLQTHCFEVNARCHTSQHQMRHVSTPDEPTEGI